MDKNQKEKFDGLTANIPAIFKERLLAFIEEVEDEAFGRGYSDCEDERGDPADEVEYE